MERGRGRGLLPRTASRKAPAIGLRVLDRVAEARAIIAAEGLTFNDRHGCPRVHPACIVERDNKIAAGRLIKELALDPPADKNPGGFGVTPSTLRRPWE